MELHGQALLDYINGDEDAQYILRRDDGVAYPTIYSKQFFYPEGLPATRSQGRVFYGASRE
jgi:hypothetical protein